MAITFLVDEQINPRVAKALRDNGIEAQSLHELGLANQRFQDDEVLNLAVERENTLLTLDDDFLRHHANWQAQEKEHFGIFYGSTAKYQQSGAIGLIINFCIDWDTLISEGAGTLEGDIYNQIIFIQEV